MKIELCELKTKEVINICDGKRLGKIIDLLIDCGNGHILGIIVPGDKCIPIFRPLEDVYVPWCNIVKIGDDVIMVDLEKKVEEKC